MVKKFVENFFKKNICEKKILGEKIVLCKRPFILKSFLVEKRLWKQFHAKNVIKSFFNEKSVFFFRWRKSISRKNGKVVSALIFKYLFSSKIPISRLWKKINKFEASNHQKKNRNHTEHLLANKVFQLIPLKYFFYRVLFVCVRPWIWPT